MIIIHPDLERFTIHIHFGFNIRHRWRYCTFPYLAQKNKSPTELTANYIAEEAEHWAMNARELTVCLKLEFFLHILRTIWNDLDELLLHDYSHFNSIAVMRISFFGIFRNQIANNWYELWTHISPILRLKISLWSLCLLFSDNNQIM